MIFGGIHGYDAALQMVISKNNPDMTAYYFHSSTNRLIEKPKNRGANWVGYGSSGCLFLWADERIGGGGGRDGDGGSHGGGGGSLFEFVMTAVSYSSKGVYTAKSKPSQSGGDALDGHYFSFKTDGNPADAPSRGFCAELERRAARRDRADRAVRGLGGTARR